MTAERIRQLVRDTLLEALGLWIIYHQAFEVPPEKMSEVVLTVGVALVTGTATNALVAVRRGQSTSPGSGSPSSPSPSPSSSSPRPTSPGGEQL